MVPTAGDLSVAFYSLSPVSRPCSRILGLSANGPFSCLGSALHTHAYSWPISAKQLTSLGMQIKLQMRTRIPFSIPSHPEHSTSVLSSPSLRLLLPPRP